MSRTRQASVTCPGCGGRIGLETFSSVNADRHPELRAAVLDGSLQRAGCACGVTVRIGPELSYLDVAHGHWIAVEPHERLPDWRDREQAATALHAVAFGPAAPQAARDLGAAVTARLVFGWDALREKLVARELGLDDVALEGLKLLIMKQQGLVPQAGEELRLLSGDGERLRLGLVTVATGEAPTGVEAPRSLHDDVATGTDWAPLRADLSAGLFVDAQRLYYGD